MPLILTAGPACEPVSLAEAKSHCRISTDADDSLLSSLILAARLHIEQSLGLALLQQKWAFYLDHWPTTQYAELPISPLISIDAVRLHSSAGSIVALDPRLFVADAVSRRPRLARTEAQCWPMPLRNINSIEIAFTAGYGVNPEDVPAPLKHAIMLLVAHWYEAREPVTLGNEAEMVPLTVASLLHPFREIRL